MKTFLVVSISFLLCGVCTNTCYLRSVRESSESELEEVSPDNQGHEEIAEASMAAPEMVDPLVEECSNITLGVNVQTLEGTNIQNITTSNAFECCEACQGVNRCTSWIHNRENGLCALYNAIRATVTMSSGSELDIGGFPSQENTSSPISARNSSNSGSMIFAAPIVPEAPVPQCNTNQGVTYPSGDVLAAGNTGSDTFCCELCRSSRNCNSWFYNRRNNRCTMNRNIPVIVGRQSSQFRGGSILD